MEVKGDEGVREVRHSFAGSRPLLVLAGAVFLLSAVALALTCVDAANSTSSAVPTYQNGWEVGSVVLMHIGSAIYLPGLILGLAALGLAQSEAGRERAARMACSLLFLGVLVVGVGIGRAICEVGSDYNAHMETLRWPVAQQAFGLLSRALLQAGTLAGLAYLSRQRPEPQILEESTSSERTTS